MEKRILEEQVTHENGFRIHRQVIEQRTTKAEDMLELGQLYMTLGRLETQLENLREKIVLDKQNEVAYKNQIETILADQDTIKKAIEIQNQYITGFNKE